MNVDCYGCDGCERCEECEECNECEGCIGCIGCDGCFGCENLVNGFRCSKVKLIEKNDKRYWIFNKEVTKEEWDNRYSLEYVEKEEVCEKCGQPLKKSK